MRRYIINKNLVLRVNKHLVRAFFYDDEGLVISNYEDALRNGRMLTALCGYRFDPTAGDQVLYKNGTCAACQEILTHSGIREDVMDDLTRSDNEHCEKDAEASEPEPAPYSERAHNQWAIRYNNHEFILMSRHCDENGKSYDDKEVPWMDIGTFRRVNDATRIMDAMRGVE